MQKVNEVKKLNSQHGDKVIFTSVSENKAFH
jgi:hypothetical protein